MNKTQGNLLSMLLSILKFWAQGAIEMLFYFPVIFMIDLWSIPAGMQWFWLLLLTLFYLSGSIARMFLPLSKRWQQISVTLVASGVVSFVLFDTFFAMAVTFLIGAFAMRRGMFFVEAHWSYVFPMVAIWSGLIVYFFAYFVYLRYWLLEPYAQLVTWLGMASLAIALFHTNSSQFRGGTHSEEKRENVSASVILSNRLLVVGLLTFIFIIAYFKQIKAWFFAIIRSIVQFIFSILPGNSGETVPPENQVNMPKPKVGPPEDPSIWDAIFYYLTLAVTIAVFLFILYFIVRTLIKIIYRLYQWFMQSVNGSNTKMAGPVKAFTDEKTNLFHWKALGDSFGDRLKDWFAKWLEKEPRWEDLKDNKEKIRYLYRHFVMRTVASGYTFKPSFTPRETATDVAKWDKKQKDTRDALIDLYHEARYGETEPEGKDMEKLKRDVLGE